MIHYKKLKTQSRTQKKQTPKTEISRHLIQLCCCTFYLQISKKYIKSHSVKYKHSKIHQNDDSTKHSDVFDFEFLFLHAKRLLNAYLIFSNFKNKTPKQV